MKKTIITLGVIAGLLTTLQARTLEEAVDICNQGEVMMCIGLGDDFMENKKPDEANKYYKKGLAILQESCDKSANPDSCFAQAEMVRKGQGVKADKKEAEKLYKKAQNIFKMTCEAGDQESCHMEMQTKMRIEMLSM